MSVSYVKQILNESFVNAMITYSRKAMPSGATKYHRCTSKLNMLPALKVLITLHTIKEDVTAKFLIEPEYRCYWA
jgi:hypothetical protein